MFCQRGKKAKLMRAQSPDTSPKWNISLGFLAAKFSYQSAFLFAAFLPLIGVIFIFRLRELPPEKSENHFQLLRKAMTSKTAWRLSTIWFSLYFVFGLAIGLIPIFKIGLHTAKQRISQEVG